MLCLLLHIAGNISFARARAFFPLFKIRKLFTVAADAVKRFFIALAAHFKLFVTFGAAGVCDNGNALSVAAFPVLTNEHFSFFAVDFKQIFAAFGAGLAGHIVMPVFHIAVFNGVNERACVGTHFFNEFSAVRAAFGNQRKPLFPTGGKLGGFEVGRHYFNKLSAL